jgi:hypothetical protein
MRAEDETHVHAVEITAGATQQSKRGHEPYERTEISIDGRMSR